ncbi:hypothetical protein C8T65DRAFT_5057 [Cerioporus squamosus]|nr:hypothetical protein C8T65DRAFT_5057 [Cerioporus squamosus]
MEIYSSAATDTEGSTLPRLHPVFAKPFANGDIKLLSSDNVLFPMSANTLSRASGWFNAMFSLPQSPADLAAAKDGLEPLEVTEPSEVLAGLLSIISGIALPAMDDIDFVESVLYAADKYDMPLPIAVLRAAALPLFLQTRPIRAYAMACHMSWETEAKEAASRTLGLDIMATENAKDIGRLDTPYLLKLLALHGKRRNQLAVALDNFTLTPPAPAPAPAPGQPVPFHNLGGGGPAVFFGMQQGACNCTGSLERQSWWAFKLAWSRQPWRFVKLREHDARPTLAPELERLFNDKCGRCARSPFDENAFTRLKQLVSQLPQTIEWF